MRSMLKLSAIVAGVLFAVGYSVGALVPGGGNVEPEDFTDFYDSDGMMVVALILVFVLVAASWAVIWFFAELRSRLGETLHTRLALGLAIAGAAGTVVGGVLLLAPSAVQLNSEQPFVGVEVAHTFAQAGYGVMIVMGVYTLAAAVALASYASNRAGIIPRWFAIASGVVAVLLLASYFWIPGYLFSLWLIAFGVIARNEPARVA